MKLVESTICRIVDTFMLARYSFTVFLSCWAASSALKLQKIVKKFLGQKYGFDTWEVRAGPKT